MKDTKKNPAATYALRLPRSIKKEVERLARQDGTTINQFIATAVAEKIAAMETTVRETGYRTVKYLQIF